MEEPKDSAALGEAPEAKCATLSSPPEDDPVAKLRAAHEARKARRGPRGRSFIENKDPSPEKQVAEEEKLEEGEKKAEKNGASAANTAELEKLREELASAKVEMASMRRNHMRNAQKLSAERDMFAKQLAQEQAEVSPESLRGLEELRTELKATRLRNANLEEENVQLRQQRKELALRATASRTIDAASSGYEKVVVDLIEVKLKCATLNDEKEVFARECRNLKTNNESLSEANRLLEKSRAEWVLKCAELERKLQDGVHNAGAKNGKTSDSTETPPPKSKTTSSVLNKVNSSPSQNSDLQELAL